VNRIRWSVLLLAVIVCLFAAPGADVSSSAAGAQASILLADPPADLCWRMGYDAMPSRTTNISRFPEIESLKAGVYQDWLARRQPARPGGMEYLQTIRLHQKLSCGSWWAPYRDECPVDTPYCALCPYTVPYSYVFSPSAEEIALVASMNPGATWQIGNEMDRRDYCYGNPGSAWCGQDEILPEVYAVAFHDLRQIIKNADPSAKIAIGAIIQATPLRLQYLTRVWDEYLRLYGEPMPVDVWNTHNFILREVGGYGASIPPGFALDHPDAWNPANDCAHVDMDVFDQFIRAFRTWMKERGQQDKPLIVTEFGVLYKRPYDVNLADPQAPCGSFDSALFVQQFMVGAFDYFRSTKDCAIGSPSDECRLVQRWLWYSLDDAGEGSNFNSHGALMNPGTLNITSTGAVYRDYCASHRSELAYPVPVLTPTGTATSTSTPTVTPTATSTSTGTASATHTPSCTPTATYTPSHTPTPTVTPPFISTPTASSTAIHSPTLTATPSPTPTATATSTRTSTSTITPSATPTWSVRPVCWQGQIGASAGDTTVKLGAAAVNLPTEELVHIGARMPWGAPAYQYVAGFRFLSVPIPQGAKVTEARMSVVPAYASGAPLSFSIRGEDADSSQPFTGPAALANQRPRTTAEVPWHLAAIPTYGSWLVTTDLAPLVDEIVGRPGWLAGNPLTLLVDSTSGTQNYLDVWAWDRNLGPELSATIDICWLPAAAPSPTATPTTGPTPTATDTATCTPEPSATATPTATPSATATASATPTSAPEATPTATPISACTEAVDNGGFEGNSAWTFPITESTAAYSSAQAHSGARSARFGLLPDAQVTTRLSGIQERNLLGELAPAYATYSSGYQTVFIPADVSSAVLSFWYLPGSEATSGDFQRVLLLRPVTYSVVANLMQVLEGDGLWKQQSFDLTAYRGQSIVMYFEVYNNSTASAGRSWMFLDDVSLQACTAAPVTATPTPTWTAAPTETPSATPTQTPTVTPTWSGPPVCWQSRIATSADDSMVQLAAGAVNQPNQENVRMGTRLPWSGPGYSYAAAFRFTSVPIPQGATITEASLSVVPVFMSDAPVNLSIRAEDADFSPPFSDGQPLAHLRTRTSASVDWSIPTIPAYGQRFSTPDLAPMLDEIIHRPGWYAGSALSILVDSTTSTQNYLDVWAWDRSLGPELSAIINICYLPGGGPWHTATPTAMATATSTMTPTATPTSTSPATPTPTALPPCSEAVVNGGFESTAAWTFPLTDSTAGYSTAQALSGTRSARFGLLPAAQVSSRSPELQERNLPGELAPTGASYSSGYQIVTVPSAATSASLSFWCRPGSQASADDFQRVLLLRPGSYTLVATLMKALESDGVWKPRSFDLTAYRGQSIVLYFEVYNNSTDATGRTWMFVDDVSLQVCSGSAAMVPLAGTSTRLPGPVFLPLLLNP